MPSRLYEVRIDGEGTGLRDLGSAGVVESVEHEATTVVSGSFANSEALSLMLRRLRAHGLEVLEIRLAPGPDASSAASDDEW